MNKRMLILPAIFGIFLCSVCAGCVNIASQTSRQPRLYVLSALVEEANRSYVSPKENQKFIIGINPVDLPGYLDRPQIMTMVGDNEFSISEFEMWAEPLKKNISRVIAQNLKNLVRADIRSFPWIGSGQITHRLNLKIIRFEGCPGRDARLEANWSVIEEQTKTIIFSKTSHYSESCRSDGFNALISAYNRILESFSKDIAVVFRKNYNP